MKKQVHYMFFLQGILVGFSRLVTGASRFDQKCLRQSKDHQILELPLRLRRVFIQYNLLYKASCLFVGSN